MSLEKQNEDPQPTAPAVLDDLSQTQKDELLLKFLASHERHKERLRICQSKYEKNKRLNDEEYRLQKNQKSSEYCRNRYNEDPEYRERARERARRSYQKRKEAKEVTK
jgi:hypothetical protein